MKAPKPPKSPEHLSDDAKERWEAVNRTWVIGPDGLPLLQAALEQWDAYQAARAVLAAEGPTVRNPESGVIRQHPAAVVAKDALRGFLAAWRALGLDPTEGAEWE